MDLLETNQRREESWTLRSLHYIKTQGSGFCEKNTVDPQERGLSPFNDSDEPKFLGIKDQQGFRTPRIRVGKG